jgi:hypothetical protein
MMARTQENLLQQEALHLRVDVGIGVDLVPVDRVVANAVTIHQATASDLQPGEARFFHLNNPTPPTIDALLNVLFRLVGIAAPQFILRDEEMQNLGWLDEKFNERINFYSTYFRRSKVFERSQTAQWVGQEDPASYHMPDAVLEQHCRWYLQQLQAERANLPHLSDQPDALFDWLQAAVTALPPAPVGVQYRRVFAALAQQYGASAWVERSGGGLRIVERLIEHFPQARFIHIVRNGPDTALSMSEHRGFRMVFAAFQLLEVLGLDPFVSSDRRWQDDLSDEQIKLLPENFTKQALLDFSTPAPMCGHYWSGEIRHGLPLLLNLPPERLLTIRYEDILQHAALNAERMLRFIQPTRFDTQPAQDVQDVQDAHNVQDRTWVSQAAALVRSPTANWQAQPPRLLQQTRQSCQLGMAALAQAGVTYEA